MANMWDQSQILLANQSGANLAAGIDRGTAAMAKQILRNADARKKSESLQKVLGPLLKQAGMEDSIAGLTPENAGYAYDQAKTRLAEAGGAQMRALEMESARLQNEQQAWTLQQGRGNAAALRETGASMADDAAASLKGYLSRGGNDPRMTGELWAAAQAQLQRRNSPGLTFMEDPVSGKRFATLGNQMQPSGVNPSITHPDTGVRKIGIGTREYFVGPGNRYFNAEGEPVTFGAGSDLGGLLDTAAGGPASGAQTLSPEDQAALDWAARNPLDPRAAQIRAKLGVR